MSKSTGVKRSFILAAVKNIPETHFNMKVIWDLLKLDEVLAFFSLDLKMANVLCGLSASQKKKDTRKNIRRGWKIERKIKRKKKKHITSDVGSQYRCGPVGRGIQPAA